MLPYFDPMMKGNTMMDEEADPRVTYGEMLAMLLKRKPKHIDYGSFGDSVYKRWMDADISISPPKEVSTTGIPRSATLSWSSCPRTATGSKRNSEG